MGTKYRIILRGSTYLVQYKGWFLWHTCQVPDDDLPFLAYDDIEFDSFELAYEYVQSNTTRVLRTYA